VRPHQPAPRRKPPAPGVAEQILGLLDLLYRAAAAGTAWDAFLERLGAVTASEVVPFLVWDYARRDGQCLRVFPLDSDLVAEYQSWAPKNAYVRPEPRLETGQVRVGHNLASCIASTDAYSIHLSPLRDSRKHEYGRA
jgi:hypothetical protein